MILAKQTILVADFSFFSNEPLLCFDKILIDANTIKVKSSKSMRNQRNKYEFNKPELLSFSNCKILDTACC